MQEYSRPKLCLHCYCNHRQRTEPLCSGADYHTSSEHICFVNRRREETYLPLRRVSLAQPSVTCATQVTQKCNLSGDQTCNLSGDQKLRQRNTPRLLAQRSIISILELQAPLIQRKLRGLAFFALQILLVSLSLARNTLAFQYEKNLTYAKF